MKYFLLTVLGAALLGIWGVSAVANFSHGLMLGGSSDWAPAIACASAACEVIQAGALLSAVWAYRKSLWAPMAACMVLWAASTAWSSRMALGFITTLTADATIQRAATGDEYAILKQRIDQKLTGASFVDSTVVTETTELKEVRRSKVDGAVGAIAVLKGRSKELGADLDTLTKQLKTAKPPVDGDPVATMLREEFGIDEKKSRLWTILGFVLLLTLSSNLGLLAFSHLYEAEIKKPDHDEDAPSVPEDDAVEEPEPLAAAVPKPRLVVSNTPGTSRNELRQHTLAFMATIQGGEIGMKDAQEQYVRWCAKRQVQPLKPWHLGQQLIAAGCVRAYAEGGDSRYVLPVAA